MSTFAEHLKASRNPADSCIRFVLLWAAYADGQLDDDELDRIRELLPERPGTVSLVRLTRIVGEFETSDQVLAFELLRRSLDAKQRRLLVELAINVLVADGRMAHAEVHALRLLADIFGVSPQDLDSLYSQETGTSLPEPPDLSDPSFWDRLERAKRERSAHSQRESSSDGARRGPASNGPSDRRTAEALATLGLVAGASQEEIKFAYRRMASAHHPDRFSGLGQSAVAAATATFQRIQSAYEHLTRAGA